VSYGLYIYHPLMFLAISRACSFLGLEEAWWTGLVKLTSSVVLASLSWRYVERPILVLRDRFRYGAVRSVRGATGAGALRGADA